MRRCCKETLKRYLAEAQEEAAEREQVVAALRETQKRYRHLVDNATDIVYRTSPRGIFTYVNHAVEHLLGYKPEEVIGRHYLDFVAPAHRREATRVYLRQVARRIPSTQHELVVLASDGAEHWVEQNVQLIVRGDAVAGFQAIARDVTRRKQIEAEHAKLIDMIEEERNTERELVRARDDLLAMVSHELASPATSLVGYAELLATMSFDDQDRDEILTTMVAEGERLATIIHDFLDMRRLEHGGIQVSPRPMDLSPLLDHVWRLARADSAHPFTVDRPRELPLVIADAGRIQQVLTNLLSNAQKYTPPGGLIRMTVQVIDRALEIAVADPGLGIPAHALPHVFDKFFRVGGEDRKSVKGTGLGLAIVKDIVERHGGEVGAESAGLGRGSRFWFRLPISTTI